MIDVTELIVAAVLFGCFFSMPIIAAFVYIERKRFYLRNRKVREAIRIFGREN